MQFAHLPLFTSSVRVHDVIRERVRSTVHVLPIYPCPDEMPLSEWARRENHAFHAQWERLAAANRDAWAALGSEYVEPSTS